MLIDTSAIVAILQRNDPGHIRCAAMLDDLTVPPVTTLAVLTESLHIMESRHGWRGQSLVWGLRERSVLAVDDDGHADLARAAELMRRYQDQPMDFADASLVALAERLADARIMTLDRHFSIYRVSGRRRFECLPS